MEGGQPEKQAPFTKGPPNGCAFSECPNAQAFRSIGLVVQLWNLSSELTDRFGCGVGFQSP
jgi:hypothetical protein